MQGETTPNTPSSPTAAPSAGSQPARPTSARPAAPAASAATTAAPSAPPAEPKPNPLAHTGIPFQVVDFNAKGYHLDVTVAPDKVVWAAEQLNKEGFSLDTITGVDWMAEAQMEVVYDYFHPTTGMRAVVRSRIPRDHAEISSIHHVFSGANWHERETHDFFGIKFTGHPNLTPFLLPEDATYHPLRKDFTS